MKKNVNITNIPTIRVEVAKAPQTRAEFLQEQGLNLAVMAATTLVTGMIGAICTRIANPKPKKVKTAKSVEEVIEEAKEASEK